MRYQPTRASAAAWRRFILLFLEAGIVGRDAGLICQKNISVVCSPDASRWADPILVTFCDSSKFGSHLLARRFRLVNIIATSPLKERHNAIDLRLVPFHDYWRYQQIPAQKRERGCVTGFICS